MIAPLVKWQHDHSWNVVFSKKEDMVPGERRYTFLAKSKQHAYLFDHVIDGRNVVPGTAYLVSTEEYCTPTYVQFLVYIYVQYINFSSSYRSGKRYR